MALAECLETLQFHATQCVQEASRFRREGVPTCADNHVETHPIGLADAVRSNLPHERFGSLLAPDKVDLLASRRAV